MRSGSDRAAFAGVAVALATCAGSAGANGAAVDSSYGRIAGDIAVVLGAGGVVAPRGLRAEAELRLRYLESAGLFATIEDAGVSSSASEPRSVFVTGLELRPLFLFRWLKGHEVQRARLDLALDSIGLDLGAMFEQPAGASFASRTGFELGLGLELPILERASGPWIGVRGDLRWGDVAPGSGVPGADDFQAVVAVTLAWHQILSVHLVDVGDRPPR
ncbi:MAG TPA: hypothetical protein VN894_20740 [Polyangiaceae bacterium]|nr:hypothetical protein [Polyangiaceae bacterium]